MISNSLGPGSVKKPKIVTARPQTAERATPYGPPKAATVPIRLRTLVAIAMSSPLLLALTISENIYNLSCC